MLPPPRHSEEWKRRPLLVYDEAAEEIGPEIAEGQIAKYLLYLYCIYNIQCRSYQDFQLTGGCVKLATFKTMDRATHNPLLGNDWSIPWRIQCRGGSGKREARRNTKCESFSADFSR